MEHVLMDDRGNTTKATYSSQSKRSVVSYALFASMFIILAGGGFALYTFLQRPVEAAMFTPMLSSPESKFGGHCTVTPDAEDFAPCTTDYETTDESQILRCPSGYGNIRVTKVRDGENGKKLYRDMAVLRHFCKGMDTCEFALAELRAADDGMPLEEPETHIDAIIIEPIEPEEIVDQVAGVDSNGHVLLKRHSHSHSRYPGKVKVYYECEKNEEDPFEALANFFDDILMSGPGEIVDEPPTEYIPVEEEIGVEELPAEETPIVLSKKHKHGGCHSGLKQIAEDWDAGAVCGTLTEEITLTCDENRSGARIFVMAVKPKGNKIHNNPADTGADAVIDNTQESVENEPFLARHKHGKHGAKQGKKAAKQLGWQLTDVCNSQENPQECTVVLNEALGEGAFADNPLVTEESPIHVKYMCSYDHQAN